MSVHLVRLVIEKSEHDGPRRLGLLIIAEACGEKGTCFLRMATIAERMKVSVRQARRVIADLIESGELVSWRDHHNGCPTYAIGIEGSPYEVGEEKLRSRRTDKPAQADKYDRPGGQI